MEFFEDIFDLLRYLNRQNLKFQNGSPPILIKELHRIQYLKIENKTYSNKYQYGIVNERPLKVFIQRINTNIRNYFPLIRKNNKKGQ